jgi:hypothetical protein
MIIRQTIEVLRKKPISILKIGVGVNVLEFFAY